MLRKIDQLRLKLIIDATAKEFDLDPKLIRTIIKIESSGRKLARRFEPAFYDRYLKGKPLLHFVPTTITQETERIDRAFSYGLMQVMGLTARELGFKGETLTELLSIKNNIFYGCKKLAWCFKKEQGNWLRAVARYNGNPDLPQAQGYAQKVKKEYER